MGLETSKPMVEPPTIIAMRVTPPAAAVAAPRTETPTPPRPRPRPRPAAKPASTAPSAPPSERAVTPPEARPLAEAASPSVMVAEGDAARETLDASHGLSDPAPSDFGPLDLGPTVFESAAAAPPAPAEEAPLELPRSEAGHLDNPPPVYPSMSRRFNEQGRVLLDVYILADGRVGEIKLNQSSGFRRLDAAALEAVRHWRYVPARRGQEPIPYWYVQPISFSLSR